MKLLEAVGGEAALAGSVDKFFARVTADPLLRLYFEDANLAALKPRFAKYLLYALGGGPAYEGRGIYEAHVGRQINDEAFDLFLQYLRETLLDAGVTPSVVDELIGKLTPLKNQIVDSFVWPGTYFYGRDKAQ